jgi:hypothetical protein
MILQQIDGNIIGPKILGSSTGLNSFWVIFALLLFGGLFGVAGMLLGVPVFAVFYHLIDEACKALLTRKGLSPNTDDYILLTRVEKDGYRRSVDPAYETEPAETSLDGEEKEEAPNPVIHWFTKLRESTPPQDSQPQEPQAPQDHQETPNEPNENEGTEQ